MVIAAGFAGMFIGANVLSIAADRLGRRRVFILNLLVYSVFSFAAAFSPNIETFLVLRVLAGIGLGAELVLVDTYLAEFMPAQRPGPDDGVGLHDRIPRGAAGGAARRQIGGAP